MTGDFTYYTDWFEESLRNCWSAREVTLDGRGRLRVVRDHPHPAVTVAPIATPWVDVATVKRVLADGDADVIVLVPKESHYDWDARMFAEENGSSVQTVKEIFTSLAYADPRPIVDKPTAYCVRALRGHSIVRAVEMICESSARVRRRGRKDVVVGIEHVYEFGEEAVVHALERHPDIDAILNSNVNGTMTRAARRHASQLGVGLFDLRGLMSALHRE